MGHRTAISDDEFERATTVGPESDSSEMKAKVVEAEDDEKPVTSTRARSKAK